MTPPICPQPVRDAQLPDEVPSDRPAWWRRSVAGPTGVALLIAGGALLVRVAVLAAQSQDELRHPALYTAALCVMSGVALVLIALPKIVAHGDSGDEDHEPPPGVLAG